MRFRQLLFLLGSWILTLQPSAFAQSQAPRDPSALAAIQAAVIALGGNSLQDVDSCVAQGQVTQNGATGTFKWENAGGEFRYETTVNGNTSALVSNHGSPATTGTQVQHWPPHFAAASLVAHLIGHKLSLYSSDQSTGLALLPSDPTADVGVFRVQVSFPLHSDLMARRILQEWRISQNNGLPLAVRQQVPGFPIGNIMQISESDFSNYQTLGGLLVPTHIDQYLGANPVASFDLSSVQCGATINPSDFTVPAGAQ